MRIVVSLRLRLGDTIKWTASTVHIPPSRILWRWVTESSLNYTCDRDIIELN